MSKFKTTQEVLAEHLKNFSEDVDQMVRDRFEADKGVDPVVFALCIQDGKLAIAILAGLGQFFTSDQGKDMAAQIIKESAKHIKPVAIAFVSEAWVSEKAFDDYQSVIDENGDYREGIVRPKDDPNRKEIVMMNFETVDKERFIHYDIVREGGTEDGKVIGLKPSKIMKDGISEWKPKTGTRVGRFMDLLQDNYDELHQLLLKQINENLN